MIYTIISAKYANEDSSAAVIMTKEAATVLISKVDTPKQWQNMIDWGNAGNQIIAYKKPEPEPDDSLLDALKKLLENPDVKSTLLKLIQETGDSADQAL